MTNAIDKIIKFDSDFIEELRFSTVISSSTAKVINAAIDLGGFVAGGFARKVAHHKIVKIPLLDFDMYQDLSDYIAIVHGPKANESSFSFGPITQTPVQEHQWRFGTGDIDIFFPDQKSVTRCLQVVSELECLEPETFQIIDSPMKYAKDVVCQNKQRVQLITQYTGSKEEILSSFDVYNAMCSFDRDELTIPEQFEFLENNNMLHMNRTDSNWAFSRLMKWKHKQGYKNLSPSTTQWFAEKIFDLIEQCNKAGVDCGVEFENKTIHKYNVSGWANEFIDSFNPEDLLKLSVFLGKDGGYNKAFQHLCKKVKLPGA